MNAILLLSLCLPPLLSALLPSAEAADLTVNGTTLTLGGTQSYDNVYIINGGTLLIADYTGAASTGLLRINAQSIYVDSTSSITGIGAGYRGQLNGYGEGTGGGQGGATFQDSGGGGGYGGAGGNGVRDNNRTTDGRGGAAYGTSAGVDIDMGSAGGAGGGADGDSGGYGADGGGALWLQADTITIAGTINVRGNNGALTNNDAAGGGAGGGVLLYAASLNCTGTVYSYGGDGATIDDSGGGGAGGRVKQFYDSLISACSTVVTGGNGPRSATDGSSGSATSILVDYDGDGFTSAAGDCDPADSAVYPGATEVWYDGVDADCSGGSDFDQDGDG